MNPPDRRIAHLDMDAFYASVELLRYPELKGLPVVIGGGDDQQSVQDLDGVRQFARLRDYVGRGVVTTSTYEARALGVFSAMGMMKAAKLAPDAVLLPADFNAYRHYSRLFKEAVAVIAPEIEDSGIDEIYEKAKAAGALGGKITGAGGGGFMLFFVRPEQQARVKDALQHLLYVPIRLDHLGSQIIYYSHED